jgi:hypothetical protein
MKKYVIFGLVLAAALILSSCGPRGGIVIVNNEATGITLTPGLTWNNTVTVTLTGLGKSQKGDVKTDESIKFDFADDGDYLVTVDLVSIGLGIKATPATVHVAGGNTVTVTLSKE